MNWTKEALRLGVGGNSKDTARETGCFAFFNTFHHSTINDLIKAHTDFLKNITFFLFFHLYFLKKPYFAKWVFCGFFGVFLRVFSSGFFGKNPVGFFGLGKILPTLPPNPKTREKVEK